jgi:hypothetical protein
MLTALFAAAAVHAVRHVVLSHSSGWRDQGDQILHAAMALAMAVMPWSWGAKVPQVPQTAFFTAAALWFLVTVGGRPAAPRLLASWRRLPYAAGMAAMAWMARTPHSMTHASHEDLAGGLSPAPVSAPPAHPMGGSKAGDIVTVALVLYLLVCALRSLTRDLPALRGGVQAVGGTLREVYRHFWEGSMALGTVVMLLLHH